MWTVRLETHEGVRAAEVKLPSMPKLPDVILKGERFYRLFAPRMPAEEPSVYRECAVYVVPLSKTPSCPLHPEAEAITAHRPTVVDRIWICLTCGKHLGAAGSTPEPDWESVTVRPGK